MRVRDLQEFLSKFTEARKDGSKQGNAISDAVIYVEKDDTLEEIQKMYTRKHTYSIWLIKKSSYSPFSS